MSAAAGALALATTLAPAASGVLPPAAAAGDHGARTFEGLLAQADGAADAAAAPDASAASPAADAAPASNGPLAIDATQPVPTAPLAAPPPMDDPATASVLNALALRVAAENRLAAASAAGAASHAMAAASTGTAGPRVASAPVGAPPLAAVPVTAPEAMVSSVAPPPFLAAAAMANASPGPLRGAASAAPGVVPLAGIDAASAEGDAASLDALLSSLDALLPPAPAKAARGASAPPPATPAAAPPIAPPLAPAPPVPPPTAGDGGKVLLDAMVDAAGFDAGGSAPGTASNAPPAATVAAAPFSIPPGAAATSAGAAPRADGAQPPIQVPFDSPHWGNELATRVVSLAREQFSEAEIRVTPDELGPIEVKLRFEGDRVHAQFGAISPEAREALTANLHRLREMFAGEGLNLGQAFVGHHGQDGARRFDGPPTRGRGSSADGADEDAPIAPRIAIAARRGLLDEFA